MRLKTMPEEQAGMLQRMLRAHGRRCGAADPEALAGMLAAAQALKDATRHAVEALVDRGYSWAEIARPLKMTRQAAQQRWGKHATASVVIRDQNDQELRLGYGERGGVKVIQAPAGRDE